MPYRQSSGARRDRLEGGREARKGSLGSGRQWRCGRARAQLPEAAGRVAPSSPGTEDSQAGRQSWGWSGLTGKRAASTSVAATLRVTLSIWK